MLLYRLESPPKNIRTDTQSAPCQPDHPRLYSLLLSHVIYRLGREIIQFLIVSYRTL